MFLFYTGFLADYKCANIFLFYFIYFGFGKIRKKYVIYIYKLHIFFEIYTLLLRCYRGFIYFTVILYILLF